MKRILIIEDAPAIRMALEDEFKFEGYHVDSAATGPEGLEKAMEMNHDIILLDLMLPGMDGLDICKELRRHNIGTPIIMLTAKSMEFDKVLGLELGADDYVTKPFSPLELRARVKAVLRRSEVKTQQKNSIPLSIGPFDMDPVNHLCSRKGVPLPLTSIEFSLMKLLMQNAGKVMEREDILRIIWGDKVYVTTRTVDAHIANLRKKVEDEPDQPRWIIGIRGVGYKFNKDE